MLASTLSALALTMGAIIAAPAAAQPAKDTTPVAPAAKSGHITVDGIPYYYEVRGTGKPLLVLHGGLGSFDMFEHALPALTAHRQVIGVDLQGHGRTLLGQRPISLEAMGADMGEILRQLDYSQVDVLGYSMGGGVAFQLALQHPDRVGRLAMVSAGYARDGFFPEMLPAQAQVGAAMAPQMKDTPMYQSYMKLAPRPEDFPRLLDAMGALMRQPYDWSADVPRLKMPVMLVYGDSDMYRPEHVVKFYQLLGGGLRDAGWQRENMAPNRLAILPGLTHYDIFLAPELVETVLPFLDGKVRAVDWGEKGRK